MIKRRHQRPYVKPKDRVCQTCKLETEDDAHFILLIIPSVTGHFIRENKVKRLLLSQLQYSITRNALRPKLILPARESRRVATRPVS